MRELTDAQMLKFFGRENLEDYNANCLVMLEAWDAGEAFLARDRELKPQATEVARLLGWTREGKNSAQQMNDTAHACYSASRLIAGWHIDRPQLQVLSVHSVKELCGRVLAQHEQLEKMSKTTGRSKRETEHAQRIVSRAGVEVASKMRAGKVAPTNIRAEVDRASYVQDHGAVGEMEDIHRGR